MPITYVNKAPIKCALPKKHEVSLAPDKEPHDHNLEEPLEDLIHTCDSTTLLDTQNYSDGLIDVGGTTGEEIPCSTNDDQLTLSAAIKNADGVGLVSDKARRVPQARTVEYGGEVYASLTKCLKTLGLCRDRFKYLKRTRKELRSDKAIIGIMVHERRADAMQGTSYVIAVKGEVCFEQNLTAACTRVNQILKLQPKQAMTQSHVSKYRYEWNRRPCNESRQISLYEAFTSCLARLLVKQQMLDDADKAMFKARMSTVHNGINNEDDLFEVVDDDDSHLEALSDLTTEYHRL